MLTKELLRQLKKYLGGSWEYVKDIGKNSLLIDCKKHQKEIELIVMMRKQGKNI